MAGRGLTSRSRSKLYRNYDLLPDIKLPRGFTRRLRPLFLYWLAVAGSMMLLPLAFLAFSNSYTLAQSSTSTSKPVPSGTAVAGSYDGLYRPQIHFSPPQGFMNDPNGMFIDAEGVHHLYYQYNPTDTIAGNQHWGHATSQDLYHWTNQPIALFPYDNVTGIFSGSCVVDVNNTSGFFPNQSNGVIAVYTANSPNEQNQAIAYSLDDGYTFTQYARNPVLSIGSMQFRDPKVFWFAPTQRWVMVVAYAQDFVVGIYTSSNLRQWTHASNFTHHGLLGLQYECPNLVSMPMTGHPDPIWVMYISINPGAPLGGSIGQYFPGSFNGTHFVAFDGVARIADFGKDNYASQFFEGIPATKEQVSIAWASNWQYTNYVPTGPREGWQSAMTLPRRNYLVNAIRAPYTLVSWPYDMSAVMGSKVQRNESLGNGTFRATFHSTGSGAFLLEVNMTNLNTTGIPNTASLNFTFSSSVSGESLRGGQFFGGDPSFYMDRGNTRGFENPYFADKVSTGLVFADAWDMQVVLDRSLWEVFLLNGTKSATLNYFPTAALDTLLVSTGGLNTGAQVSVAIWELESAWAAENSSGTKTGNNTMAMKRERVGSHVFWA